MTWLKEILEENRRTVANWPEWKREVGMSDRLQLDLENFCRMVSLGERIDKLKAENAQLKAELTEAYDAKVAGVPLGPIIGAQTILNQQIAYNQLMEQAVYFAEIADSVCRPSGLHGAAAAARFLASPAVQQWRKEQGV